MLRHVLVVPGTSLIGLEILASLQWLPGFVVHGAGAQLDHPSVEDFASYHLLPPVDSESFPEALDRLISDGDFDLLFPSNDLAIGVISGLAVDRVQIVSHPHATVKVAGSKILTHQLLSNKTRVPRRFLDVVPHDAFPVFVKPDVGHSSIGAARIDDEEALLTLQQGKLNFWETWFVSEYLPGEEVTVDCFSTSEQGLLFVAGRTRDVTSKGVSIVTRDISDESSELWEMAHAIQNSLEFNGPWFFQAKRDCRGLFRIMEVGARLAGASRIRRAQGVNLAQLAVLASDGLRLSVLQPRMPLVSTSNAGDELVTAEQRFGALYLDLDDTLLVHGAVNSGLVELAVAARSSGARVTVVTRHRFDPDVTLREHGILDIADEVVHVTDGESKAKYIRPGPAVFIDDSFAERASLAHRGDIIAADASAALMLRGLFYEQ